MSDKGNKETKMYIYVADVISVAWNQDRGKLLKRLRGKKSRQKLVDEIAAKGGECSHQNLKKLEYGESESVSLKVFIEDRSAQLQKLGFSSYDAIHIASAERSQADAFLTTDDRLLKKYLKNSQLINVKINNAVQWLAEVIQAEESNDENAK
jgi:predicted nucleic acid-binding protein